MAFTHGKDSRVLANDTNVSAELNKWTVNWKINLADTTCLGDSGARGTRGLMEGSVQAEGFFNSSAVAKPLYDEIKSTIGVDNGLNLTLWPQGGAIGNPAIFTVCDTENYSVEAAIEEAVKLKFEATSDNTVDFGVSQHDALVAETASTDSTGVDNLALTSNGGSAMLHVTAITGTTPTNTVKIQHSVDNVTYVDLVSFTALAAITTSEFKEVAAGTTVNRWTRVRSTIGGTLPNYTYGVSFARR